MNTSGVEFSRIAYNHAMEQRIKVINSTAGSTDVVNNDDNRCFKSLEPALPGIQEFLSAVEGDAPTRKHKENMQSLKDTFSEHVAKVSNVFLRTLSVRISSQSYIVLKHSRMQNQAIQKNFSG